MSYSPLQSAAIFLLDTFFTIYIGAVLLRIIFQIKRIDFHNPLAQFIVKITNPALIPIRRVVPGFKGHDIAAYVLVIILQLSFIILSLLVQGYLIFHLSSLFGLLIWCLGELIGSLLSLYTFMIFISVILSWVSPFHPISGVFSYILEPLLSPIRKRVPPIAMFDLSPLILLIAIQLGKILVSGYIIRVGETAYQGI